MEKIGIIGGGAMGSIFAYFLQKSGAPPFIYEKNPDIAHGLHEGITVTAGDKTETISFQAGPDPEILRDCTAMILFVKSYATREALHDIAPVLQEHTVIVSLQNGLGNREIIEEFTAPELVVYGSTAVGAYRSAPDALTLGGMGDTVIGGKDLDTVTHMEEILRNAGIPVATTFDPEITVWKKAVINAGINPLGALFGVTNGALIENPHSRELQESIVREAVEVADAMDIPLNKNEMVRVTAEVCRNTASNRCSMLQDLDAGRKTEIDSINGALCCYGERTGVAAPVNRTLYECIKFRETMQMTLQNKQI